MLKSSSLFVLGWAGPWSVCGTNTFAGRAVPQCPQTSGFTCGAAQETQEIKKEHKENNTKENTLLYISFVNAFGILCVYVLFHFEFFILKKKEVREKIVEQGWIVRVPWGIVPWGDPLQRGGWSRAVNENTR